MTTTAASTARDIVDLVHSLDADTADFMPLAERISADHGLAALRHVIAAAHETLEEVEADDPDVVVVRAFLTALSFRPTANLPAARQNEIAAAI